MGFSVPGASPRVGRKNRSDGDRLIVALFHSIPYNYDNRCLICLMIISRLVASGARCERAKHKIKTHTCFLSRSIYSLPEPISTARYDRARFVSNRGAEFCSGTNAQSINFNKRGKLSKSLRAHSAKSWSPSVWRFLRDLNFRFCSQSLWPRSCEATPSQPLPMV